jgi:Putative peptidoglycan binding domain
MAVRWVGSDIYAMKTIKLLTLTGAVLVGLAPAVWAGPRGGGGGFAGGGHVGGGGRVGGFAGGGSRYAPAFYGGGFRAGPTFQGSYFTGRSVDTLSAAPRFYYDGNRTAAVAPRGFPRSVERSTSPYIGRSSATTRQPNPVTAIAARNRVADPRVSTAASRQPNHVGSVAGRNQVSDRQTSIAAKRESLVRNHASERHDANWHHDWDRHHAHFHGHKVFVFIDGFWWGLDPGFYPYYAYDNYPDDSYGYANNGYPYDYYEYSPYNYEDEQGYAPSDQYANNGTVSAVQSKLAKLGYYRGAIDGAEGDETQAALARYQQDRDLSVTGTLTATTLQALGLQPVASN